MPIAIPLTTFQRGTRTVMSASSMVLVIAGVGTLALAVGGLVGRAPLVDTAAAAVIAAGCALVAQGLTALQRWGRATQIVGRERIDVIGMVAEALGGAAAMNLGALVLLDGREDLLPFAMMVLGGALVLGGRTQADLVALAPTAPPRHRDFARGANALMEIAGIAAFVVGMIAWLRFAEVGLIAVALVIAAFALLVAGGVLLSRFTRAISLPRRLEEMN